MIRVGFQMDPLDNIDPRLDTSFRLAEEAELRGYSVFHYLQSPKGRWRIDNPY